MYFIHLPRTCFKCVVFIILTLTIASCDSSKPTSPEAKIAFERVIPKAISANATGKTFLITAKTVIVAD